MKKKIKCSVIGLGRIGSLLEKDKKREKPATHAGAIHHNHDCIFLSACDTDGDRCQQFQHTWKCPNIFSNYQDLLKFELPDILQIATPPEAHFEICQESIKKGIPVIICEKPFTQSVEEARKIATQAAKANVKIIINHERRYSRDYLELKKIIQTSRFGKLLNLSARLFMGYSRAPRDLLWHDGTHMVDILRFLSDQDLKFHYLKGNLDKKASICEIGFLAGNLPIHLLAATDREYLVFELDAFFEKALIRIGNGIYEIHESRPSPFYDHFYSLILNKNHRYKNTGYFSNMLKEAINLTKAENAWKKPVSSVEDGVKSVEIIQSLLL